VRIIKTKVLLLSCHRYVEKHFHVGNT